LFTGGGVKVNDCAPLHWEKIIYGMKIPKISNICFIKFYFKWII
jgi:hypothetical protein